MQKSYNDFVEKNRQIATFLSFFADADLVGLTDDEVARQLNENREAFGQFRETVLTKSKALLNSNPFPWQEIGECANRYFSDASEAYVWLTEIIKVIEDD